MPSLNKSILLRIMVLFLICVSGTRALGQTPEKIDDPANVLKRIDIDRISYALQSLRERAQIEGSVQFLNTIEQEYPRPLTGRDLSIYILEKTKVRLRVGSELRTLFPDDRIKKLVDEVMTPELERQQLADAVTRVLERITDIGAVEGGVADAKKVEDGKALTLMIAICSATVLMFLWMLLFMNESTGGTSSASHYQFRIVVAHAVALLGVIGGYIAEVVLALGLKGMLIIPVVVVVQLVLLLRVFKALLPSGPRTS